jgi:hypothetical protein
MREKIVTGVILFGLGIMVGGLLPNRTVKAQEQQSTQQQDNWVLQPMTDKGNVWAYFFNTRTGQIFTVYGTDKAEVKPEAQKRK